MFEGFSFPSPSSRENSPVHGRDDEMMLEADSTLISPLSSRCPSPVLRARSPKDHPLFSKRSRSQFRQAPPPTSIPRGYIDGHRLSIGTLTQKLQIQSLDADASSDSDDGRGFPLTPPRSARAETPSIFLDNEPLISPGTGSRKEHTWPSLSPTSMPEQCHPRSSSLPVPAHLSSRRSSYSHYHHGRNSMREQRETLSVLQNASNSISETVRLAYMMEDAGCLSFNELDEDRHPSSLPPSPISLSRKRALLNQSSRRQSTTGGYNSNRAGESTSRSRLGSTSATKVTKNQSSSGNSDRTAHALRRRSLVLAAVTAMVDGDTYEKQNKDRREVRQSRHATPTSREPSLSLSPRQMPRSQPRRGGSPQP